jgi:hypothetical protein
MEWFVLRTGLLALGLFAGMLALLELGRRAGARRRRQEGEAARAGVAAVDGAVFALMGLLIAFTFSSAAGRFDLRKQLIVEETNAIGTAWLRVDLLPAEDQPVLRERFRAYVDSRIETYRRMPDLAAVNEELARSAELQRRIWEYATTSARESGSREAQILLLPALNQMFDITTTRAAAGLVMHAPPIVFVLLASSALASALLAGYGMAGAERPSLVHMVGFAALISLAVYVILDLEFPRVGLIRLDAADRMLVDLRASMGG